MLQYVVQDYVSVGKLKDGASCLFTDGRNIWLMEKMGVLNVLVQYAR